MIQSQAKTNADPSSLGSGRKRKLRTIRWPSWVNLSLRLAAGGLMGYSISRFHHLFNFFDVNLGLWSGKVSYNGRGHSYAKKMRNLLLMNSNFYFGVRQTKNRGCSPWACNQTRTWHHSWQRGGQPLPLSALVPEDSTTKAVTWAARPPGRCGLNLHPPHP